MEQSATTEKPSELPPFTIHPGTVMGAVHLVVRDLARQVQYYTASLGLQATRKDTVVELSADGHTPLLVLNPNPDAQIPPPNATGLYHVAIRVPSRRELGWLLMHLAKTKTALQGASDHRVSEALYLVDPEGNGVEVYRDRSAESWQKAGNDIRMDVLPLKLDDLLRAAQADSDTWTGLPPQTVVGHIHLRVSNLGAAGAFYQGFLGFDKTAAIPGQAGFVSAGGYHHHIGFNVWGSAGGKPPPPDSTGLEYFTIVLPDAEAYAQLRARLEQLGMPLNEQSAGVHLRDPAGNGLRVVVAPQN